MGTVARAIEAVFALLGMLVAWILVLQQWRLRAYRKKERGAE